MSLALKDNRQQVVQFFSVLLNSVISMSALVISIVTNYLDHVIFKGSEHNILHGEHVDVYSGKHELIAA